MSESVLKRETDGVCTYMTPEEQAAAFASLKPRLFYGEGVKNKIMDVPFGPDPDHLLDIYLPDEPAEKMPVIFDVHGGGWTMGTKNDGFTDVLIGFIRRGYALISVNYRLFPKAKFPGFLMDVKAAVRWARAHAAEYGFDPERFGMIGDSAGGHLTLMAGFSADHPEFKAFGNEEYSDALQAIVNVFGISIVDTDVVNAMYCASGVKRAQLGGGPDLYEAVFGRDPYQIRVASPVYYVTKDAPPVLSLHGRIDAVVPYQQSVAVHEKVTEVCGEGRSELIIYDDRNHEDFKFNGGNGVEGDLFETACAFFDKYLK